MTFSKLFVDLPFGMMAYTKSGEGMNRLVFLHGIPTSSFLWRGVITQLQGQFESYAPDLLGYGDSDKPPEQDLSIASQANYLADWADAVGLDSFDLIGHDIGGGVAQVFATRFPKRVNRLVLVDTVAYDSWPVPDIDRLKDPSWDERLRSRDLRSGFRRALETGLAHKEITDELLEGYVGPFIGKTGREAYLRAARALDNKDLMDISSQIEELTHPTLLLWGDQDPFQDISYGERLVKSMSDARLEKCENAGHFLPEERPDWVAEKISKFCG